MSRVSYFCFPVISRTPYIIKWLFPNLVWEIKTDSKAIYLTFDDGPHPEITPRVMETLKTFNAKATFFCVGNNVDKYPETYNQLLENGHRTGNHTYHHLKGWKTTATDYHEDISKCSRVIDSHLFRPPHGQIKITSIPYLKMQYHIVMWTVLSGDYNSSKPPEKCLKQSIKSTRKGSIVVFHDSEKASKNLFNILPAYLDYFSKQGFHFPVLPL